MKSFRLLSVGSLALFALFVVAILAGTGPLAFGQESVQGRMTLPVAAKLGNTMLPPGEYKFVISLLGETRSIRDIAVAKHVCVLLLGASKNAPVVSAIALAFPIDAYNPAPANFVSAGDTLLVNAIAFPDYGFVVQFLGASGKDAAHARATQPSAVMSAKTD